MVSVGGCAGTTVGVGEGVLVLPEHAAQISIDKAATATTVGTFFNIEISLGKS